MDFDTKLVFFSCTTIMFLIIYTFNLITGVIIVRKGMKVLHPALFFLSLLSTISSTLTVVASVDWLVFAQFMNLSTNTNFLWVLHHITSSVLTFLLHLYLLYELKTLSNNKFNKKILFPVSSLRNRFKLI